MQNALITGAITRDEVSRWAANALDVVTDPPLFLYTMLDLERVDGNELRREIGFTAGFCRTENEFQYLREIAVRRGFEPVRYLAGKPRARVAASRKALIDGMLLDQYGVDVAALPPLPAGPG